MKSVVLFVVFAGVCLAGTGCDRSKSAEENRKAAEMVVQSGGTVTLKGTTVKIRTTEKIPQGRFLLERIDLKGTGITDAELEQVQNLTEIEQMELRGTEITDAGLEYLKGLKKLKDLSLYRTAITDQGVEQLSGLTGLTKLELSYTGVSDAGLSHLLPLKNLQSLYLYGTVVTGDAIAEFKQSRPGCKIYK